MTRTLLALLVGLVLAMPGFAAVTIDFGTGSAGVGGVFDLIGPNNATGTNIPIGDVTIHGAPTNNGVFDVTGTCDTNSGCLDFNTTAHTISIFGAIPDLGITAQTLLSGTIASFTANGNFFQGTGPDTKSADLLTALGLNPATTHFNFFGFSLVTTPITTTSGRTSVISSDIRNDGTVPEPASIALFGTFLLGSGIALRRRRAASR